MLGSSRFESFDRLLSKAGAESMLRLCERFGHYGMYGEESIEDDFGEGLAQRHDAILNFLNTGGRFGRKESIDRLVARTNYFRETYAYGETQVEGIEPFRNHEGFAEAARKVHDCRVVEPNIVYANLLVPGQELAVHTDVPEFRGANRKRDPQWLLVAMHHSGLFDRWRMPIATAVSWFGNPRGGEFVFYPTGAQGPPVALPVHHNTAILLDTDSIFHGVDRVSEARAPLPELRPGMQLTYRGTGNWQVGLGDRVLEHYTWDDLRFSVSWKAYCYADEADRRRVHEHSEDQDRRFVLDTLSADLRERGRIGDKLPDDTELALTIIDEYIAYPPASPAPAPAG
ncbi:MAG: hypothetical protein V3T07_10095 [Myxococcota bacterium]